MKLLIAYDGSSCSEAAIDDLIKAGLPKDAQAIVLTIAEVWLPQIGADVFFQKYLAQIGDRDKFGGAAENGDANTSEAQTLAVDARKRLEHHFPNWKVEIQTAEGSPAQEILRRAETFEPDLIVVGSHGRSAVNRLILGSISQKVLAAANCSVRVARGKVELEQPLASERIVVGFDGFPGAQAAVNAVAARNWRAGSEVLLVAAADPLAPTTIGRFLPPIVEWVEEERKNEQQRIEQLAADAAQILRERNLKTEIAVQTGNPRQILVEQAARWHADSIFVGANAVGGQFERFLLGSVSAAVAARAHCSVEIVRK